MVIRFNITLLLIFSSRDNQRLSLQISEGYLQGRALSRSTQVDILWKYVKITQNQRFKKFIKNKNK